MSPLERIRTAPPGLQVAGAAVAAALILALLVSGYLLWFRSPYQVLFSNLRQADAAAVVAELDKRKTPYELRDGGGTILVPSKIADATRLSLASETLPLKGVVGFEIFNKSDMGLTEFAQQINYRRALQGELERTIMELDGVESARVHLTIAEPSVFRDERRPSKASVTVIPRLNRVLPPETVRGIERLVAAAAPDLDPADVVVLDARGDVVSGADAGVQPAAPQAQEKAAIESYYAGRIRQALAPVDPEGQVGVVVIARPDASRGDDAFAGWTPEQRRFPLTVSLSPRADAPVSAELRRLASGAVDLDPARGDSLAVAYVAPTPAAAAGAAVAPVAPVASPSLGDRLLGSPSRFWLVLLLPAAIIIAAAVAVIRRLEAPRRLTLQEQEIYAQRLAALLEGRDADAATS